MSLLGMPSLSPQGETKTWRTPLVVGAIQTVVHQREGTGRVHLHLQLEDGNILELPMTQEATDRLWAVLEPVRTHPPA